MEVQMSEIFLILVLWNSIRFRGRRALVDAH